MLDSATGVSVIAFDLTGTVTYFSKGAEGLLGYSSGEMTRKAVISDLHDPAELSARSEILSRELGYPVTGVDILVRMPILRGRERREWSYLRRDRHRMTVDLTVTVLEDMDGLPMGYLGTAVDITEQKEMERELRATVRAQRKSKALLESASRMARLGYWELPLDGSLLVWSDMTYRIHDLPEGTPVSPAQALEFYHPDDRTAIAEFAAGIFETDTPHEFEARLITATGRQIWVHSRRETVRDESGAVIAVQGILQDIDERRTAQELLQRRNVELEAATARAESHDRAKTEFLATMSHEIRTPLNAVIGMSELLMDSELGPREREFVETIRSSGELLLGIISDILDFSQIESGQVEMERVAVSLREWVESVLDLLAGEAAKKEIDLLCWIDPLLPAAVIGDPARLRQVLVNLTSNAVKFTPRGHVVIKLRLRDSGGAQWLQASVSDTGIGIPPDRMDRLFRVFSQVDMSNTRRFGGTGLGLAICNRLIHAMGGCIEVQSEVDKGSTFQFELPMEPLPKAASPSPSPARSGLEGLRVLVVDNSNASRWILMEQTGSWGMLATAADGAEEALERIRKGEIFDLAVIDARVAAEDGGCLADGLTQERGGRVLPVLMLTFRSAPQHTQEGAGRITFLNKPVKAAGFLDALRELSDRASGPPGKTPEPGTDGEDAARPLPEWSILVAEDNPVNRRVITLHLRRLGYDPVLVTNGLEALHAVQAGNFDVLILDVQMEVMDGLEAVREIRRLLPAEKQPWVIAMTANAFDSDREACLAAGMDDYLSKPVQAQNLKGALRLVRGGEPGRAG